MLDGWEDVERVVHCQDLSCVSEIIRIELTSYFGIEKSLRYGIQLMYLGKQSPPLPSYQFIYPLERLIDGFATDSRIYKLKGYQL